MASRTTVRDMQRLRTSMTYSRTALEPFRRKRLEALREYVGHNYSDDGSDSRMPINLLELGVTIYLQQLVGSPPQVNITTHHQAHKPTALNLSLATNMLLKRIKIRKSLKKVVFDSLFSMGIIKVGMNYSHTVEVGGVTHDIGQPFADPVFLDDWVHDMTALSFDQAEYMGNKYRIAKWQAIESGLFDKRKLEKVQVSNRLADMGTEESEHASMLSQSGAGSLGDESEYSEHIELWDLYLPAENLVVTLPVHGPDEPLRIEEWQGPEGGPYKILAYAEIPNNTMPVSTVAGWRDLNTLANALFNKMAEQALRQKTITGARGSAASDAERVVQSNDGDTILLDDPAGVKEYSYGGVNAETLALTIQMRDFMSYLAGNLDALGGLGPQAPTATQDNLLQSSASQRIQSMQEEMMGFTTEVVRDLAWYLYYDPYIQLPITKRVPGFDIEVPAQFGPEDRSGDFLDYNFEIEPFSMTRTSPREKLQAITNVMTQYILPLQPQFEAQGAQVNLQALLDTIARYGNLPEVQELVQFTGEQQTYQVPPTGQPPAKASGPTVTHRINERISRPGGTRQGSDRALVQSLMGGNPQPAEQAQIGRGIG